MTTLPISPEKKPTRHWWRISILSILSVVVVWYIVLGVGVYSGTWRGGRTESVLRITPLPVAFVKWHPIWYSDYLNQRTAVQKYTAYLASSTSSGTTKPTDVELTSMTLNTLMRTELSNQIMKTLNISVGTSDVDQAYQTQLLQNGNADQVASTIKQLYGWTPEQFKTNVVRPAVVRSSIQEKLSFDTKLSATAKTQADKVLALVKADPKNFSDLAKKYSEDTYGANGGDLGFVGKNEQDKAIEDAAFGLELNTISDVIHTQYGFHILEVTEKKTVDGNDQVHLYMITVLAPQVDTYITSIAKKTSTQVFVRGVRWDTTKGQVIAQ